MQRFITFGCISLAPVLWIAGLGGNSIALLASAGLLELTAWKRLPVRRPR